MADKRTNDKLILHDYISMMRPVFRKRAVYSDETKYFRSPFEPRPGDDVTIRIRTSRNNVDAVYFISGALREPMDLSESRGGFDYYAITIHHR